ncbi:HAMP domain-containing histidine kinase [Cyclobacteriaceae bacterium]|nr:HAMP domain-containing histidine kinase [Cyclobacteriaceae bacterium]
MRLRLIKITVLWFFSAGIIAYWLNAGKEGQVAREINNKISFIISDQLTDLHFFLDQSMHHNGADLRQSFNLNYPTYGYRDGDLVFWNSNAYFPAYDRIKTVDTVAFFSDENINVICLRVSKQEVSGALLELYSIIPIASTFVSKENQSITVFNKQLFSKFDVDFNTQGFPVSYDGKILLKLSATPNATDISVVNFMLLFFIVFTVFYTINSFLNFLSLKSSLGYLGVLVVSLCFWMTYFILMAKGGIGSITFLEYQLMPDLLFLDLEQLFFFFLFLLIILFKLTTALFKSKKVLQLTITRFRTFTIFFSFLSSIISAHLLFSGIEMIAHYSHENLDITKSVLFSNHRMLYYIFLMLLSSCYFFLNHIFYKFFIKAYVFPQHLGYVVILLLAYFIGPFGDQWYIILPQLIVWGIMFMTGCSYQLTKPKYITLFYLMLIAVFVGILNARVILKSHTRLELVQKQDFAFKIQTATDSIGEYYISRLGEKIMKDPFISLRFKNELLATKVVEDRIREIQASYLDKYVMKTYLLDDNGDSYGFTRTEGINFSKAILLKANTTSFENIYSVPMIENGYHKYYTVIPMSSSNYKGEIIVEYTKRKHSTPTVYSSFFEAKNKSSQKVKNYDYGIYQNGMLTHQLGNYKFPLKRAEVCPDISSQGECIQWNQHFYLTKIQDGRMLMVVSSAYSKYAIFANIAFIFILSLFFFGSVFFIMTRLRPIESFSLTNKIQLYVGLSFLVPTAIVSVLILSQLTSSYRAEINRSHQKKAVNIAQNFKQDLALFLNNNTNKYQLIQKIIEISNLSRSDINLYGAKGQMLASSNEDIFDQKILSKKIHPMAYGHIIDGRGQTKIIEEDLAGVKFKTVYVAVYGDQINELMGIIALPFFDSKNHVNDQQIEVFNNFMVFFTSIFILTLLVGNYGMKAIIKPIKMIAERMRRTQFMSEEIAPLTYKEKDEIGMLVFEYNQMLAKLDQSKFELAKIQKETAWRELAQQVAHEIKNPLTPMKLKIQQMQRAMNDSEANYEVLNSLLGQIDNLSSIADSFSSFAQWPAPHNEVFDFSKLVRETSSLYASDDLQIQLEITEDVMVYADVDLMRQILNNLIINAVQSHVEKPGYVEVCLEVKAHKLLLSIKDKGQGISDMNTADIFKSYFTTKENGTGIGLAFAKKGIEQAGGNIWFETKKGVGTTFFITMPRA